MISPSRLKTLPDNLSRLWSDVETEIIADMAKRISAKDMFIPAAQWQFEQAREMGFTYTELTKRLSPLLNKTRRQLTTQITKEVGRSLQGDDAILKAAGKTPTPLKSSKRLQEIIAAGIERTNGEFENLTRTTAQNARRQFVNVLDRAFLKISTGAFSRDTAIAAAIKELAESGLTAFQYENGRTTSLDAAVRRAVLTGVNQTAGYATLARCVEEGVDLVEVTAHEGARVSLTDPINNHAGWQGKIYSISGKDENHPSLYEKTGIFTLLGLLGVNCRHSCFPYIEGVSEPAWTDAELEALNAPKYAYNGKILTEYEANQLKRYYERNARKWGREAAAFDAAQHTFDNKTDKTPSDKKAESEFYASAGFASGKRREWRQKLDELNALTNDYVETSRISEQLSPKNINPAERPKTNAFAERRKQIEREIARAKNPASETFWRKELFNLNLMEEHAKGASPRSFLNENATNGLTNDGGNDIMRTRQEREPVFITDKDIANATGISREVAREVFKAVNSTVIRGNREKQRYEILTTLSASDGKEAFGDIFGSVEGKITIADKGIVDWQNFVFESKPQTLILVHNHNKISPLSKDDYVTFLGNKAIKYMFAVDLGGNVYYAGKTPGTIEDADAAKELYESIETEMIGFLLKGEADGSVSATKYELAKKSIPTELGSILHAKFKFDWKEWAR